MCCALENTESTQCGGPYRDFVSSDLGGHGFYHQLTNFNSQPLMHFYEGAFYFFSKNIDLPTTNNSTFVLPEMTTMFCARGHKKMEQSYQ
jgi:hypothetical protein